MSNDTREALAAARSALGQLIEAGKAVKAALDATIPDGEPVHPESRRLTWPLSSGLLALDAVDAALATQPAEPMELEQTLTEIAKTLPPMTTLGWNDGGMCEPDEAIKGYTKKQVLEILAAHLPATQPAQPSAQGEATQAENAARYLYIREQHWFDSDICCVTKPKDNLLLGSWCPHGQLLDDYIDERRKK